MGLGASPRASAATESPLRRALRGVGGLPPAVARSSSGQGQGQPTDPAASPRGSRRRRASALRRGSLRLKTFGSSSSNSASGGPGHLLDPVAPPSTRGRSGGSLKRHATSQGFGFGSPPVSPSGSTDGRFDFGGVAGSRGPPLESLDDHVPYRSSKLTRILRQSLGGNSFTAVLLCITPAAQHQQESVSTLQFGQSCKRIKNQVVKNDGAGAGSGAPGTPGSGGVGEGGRGAGAARQAEVARY